MTFNMLNKLSLVKLFYIFLMFKICISGKENRHYVNIRF